MKILLVAQFWKGAKDWSYKEAFEKLGHEVFIFDTYSFFANRSGKRSSFLVRISDRLFWGLRAWRMNRAFLKEAMRLNPELILVIKGKEIFPGTLRKIKIWNNSVLFNLSADDIFSPRYPTNTSRFLKKSISLYHCIFTNKPWPQRREFLDYGAQRVQYLQFGFDPSVSRPTALSPGEEKELATDVAFIGSPEAERIEVLEEIVKRGWNLKVYGPDWHRFSVSTALRKCITGRPVYCEDLAKVLSATKIALVFFRRGDRDLTNTRLFETPACGTFSLIERNLEVSRFYKEGKEVECFGTAEEACRKIEYYLAHDAWRRKIAHAGHKRTLASRYTFEDRAREILDVFQNLWMADSLHD